tara:strand:- start:16725 stop:17084 length:360 start_codon:yes stop_codon:yes gene_type:complete
MIATLLVAFVAALHVYIVLLEMLWWERPRTRKIFGISADLAAKTRVMAANQGLYNGFLAAGLVWSLWSGLAVEGREVAAFFLLCVVVAGVYGAMTVNRRILLVQALPAGLALAALVVGI